MESNLKIGDTVRSVRKSLPKGHPLTVFEGVIVKIKPNIVWGFNIIVQNVTPTPLYERGEMIECKKEQVELVDKIKPN
jgi:hypothetical protein